MAQTVVGIFDNATEAQQALQQLLSNGFTEDRIDISTRNASDTTGSTTDRDDDDGIGGFFRSLFDSDDEVNRHTEVARRGSVITVHAQSSEEAERAADIMDNYGAIDVNERAQQYHSTGNASTSDFTNTNTADFTTDTTSDFTNDTTNKSIPIIEEDLQIGKRVVETGGARLRSRIIERPVEETLRLRHERVRIERNPVNRPATEADLNTFREGEIELRGREEVPVVNKEARVVEEVSLGKEVEEHEETIRDTVRRTDVEIEDINTTENRDRLTDEDRNRRTNL